MRELDMQKREEEAKNKWLIFKYKNSKTILK